MQNPLEIPLKRLEAAAHAAMPEIVQQAGAIALEFVDENFRLQGFQGITFMPWAQRKHETKKSNGRAILVQSGNLRKNWSITAQGPDSVTIGNNLPYARIHNEGGTSTHPGGARTLSFRQTRGGQKRFAKANGKGGKIVAMAKVNVGSYTIHQTQRRMAGNSPVLDNRVEKMIITEILNQFK
ncbi:MAG: phage virion morphogenesis protein [Taibaiella sp.]|nr:phage virion morphogenesis protein [Taibaiella sp.]